MRCLREYISYKLLLFVEFIFRYSISQFSDGKMCRYQFFLSNIYIILRKDIFAGKQEKLFINEMIFMSVVNGANVNG